MGWPELEAVEIRVKSAFEKWYNTVVTNMGLEAGRDESKFDFCHLLWHINFGNLYYLSKPQFLSARWE